jgi:hypothetical protein
MKQLVYLTVFGSEYMDQFRLCLQGLKECKVDIALITDQDFADDRVKVYKIEPPPDKLHICQMRVEFQRYIDIKEYDRVWYMDCDFLIFEDLFTKYADEETIWLNAEPLQTLGDADIGKYFNLDLSPLERNTYTQGEAISGGIYSVPKKYFNYFEFLNLSVQAAWVRWRDMWGVEQMVMNSIYLRYKESWPMKLFDSKDIGFLCPRRGGVTGNEMVVHCTLYQHQMKPIWEAYINS